MIFNKIIAFLLIIFISPIFILVSLIIFISDGFPIFYVQENYGMNHKKFNLYKFRTMKNHTPQIPTEEMKNAEKYLIIFGGILRKYSIDELPQFINVLKGDINFIGPRPCMTKNEEIIKKLREQYGVHKIKPGITGLAQVEGRDSNSYEQKVDLDYTYLKNKNFLMNLRILIKTIFVVLCPRNIKH